MRPARLDAASENERSVLVLLEPRLDIADGLAVAALDKELVLVLLCTYVDNISSALVEEGGGGGGDLVVLKGEVILGEVILEDVLPRDANLNGGDDVEVEAEGE